MNVSCLLISQLHHLVTTFGYIHFILKFNFPYRFWSALKHFKLKSKHLSKCDSTFSDVACKEELKNELKILKPSTIVLILKTENCMVNFFQDMILKHFSTHPLKAYKNSNQKHGLNIIGDVNYILKTLDDQKDLVSSQYPRDNLPKG